MTSGRDFLTILKDAGFADTMVATLKSDSAYCVAMAVSALGYIGAVRGGGQALIEASGAIPALVHVIKRTRWPSEPEKQKSRCGRWARGSNLSPCVPMSSVSNDIAWRLLFGHYIGASPCGCGLAPGVLTMEQKTKQIWLAMSS
jgi:hypothetical protein